MDSDSDRGILALGEDIVCRQESKAVGTDIIHGGRIFRIRILNLMVQALFRSIRGYLRRLFDPGSGINDDFEGMSTLFRSGRDDCLVPTIQDVACGDL